MTLRGFLEERPPTDSRGTIAFHGGAVMREGNPMPSPLPPGD
jgi:hypothetical protein